jgi:hypothetical protein
MLAREGTHFVGERLVLGLESEVHLAPTFIEGEVVIPSAARDL